MLWQKAVSAALAANVPVLIEGDPGIGKTSFIYALGRGMGCIPEVVIASLREPSDFLGLPVIADDGCVKMAPPSWAKRLAEKGQDGLLIFDEITTAPPAVQAALLRVVLERVVGDLTLPPGVRIVAIANAADQVNGWELSLPLSNRFFHLQAAALDVKTWSIGMQEGWKTPPPIPYYSATAESTSKAKALVAGFLNTRPSLLLAVPQNDAKDRAAWPSPRSWESAARLLAVVGSDEELTSTVLSGTVGHGAAREFMSWFKALDLPDPEYLLANPRKFKVPDRIDKVFVILDSVTSTAINQMTGVSLSEANDVWLRIWEIIQKVCDAKMSDVALLTVKKLAGVPGREKFALPHNTIDEFRDLLAGLA